jgi:hypothetical protein
MKDPQNAKQQLYRMIIFFIISVSMILQGCPQDLINSGSNYSGSSGGSAGGRGSGSRTGTRADISGPMDASGPSGPIYKPAPDPLKGGKRTPDPRKPDGVKQVNPNILR